MYCLLKIADAALLPAFHINWYFGINSRAKERGTLEFLWQDSENIFPHSRQKHWSLLSFPFHAFARTFQSSSRIQNNAHV